MAKVVRSKVDAVLSQIAELSEAELDELQVRMAEAAPQLSGQAADGTRAHPLSIMQAKGLGKDFWRSIDVDTYIKRERDSWGS
jgi:hypothetical protein